MWIREIREQIALWIFPEAEAVFTKLQKQYETIDRLRSDLKSREVEISRLKEIEYKYNVFINACSKRLTEAMHDHIYKSLSALSKAACYFIMDKFSPRSIQDIVENEFKKVEVRIESDTDLYNARELTIISVRHPPEKYSIMIRGDELDILKMG